MKKDNTQSCYLPFKVYDKGITKKTEKVWVPKTVERRFLFWKWTVNTKIQEDKKVDTFYIDFEIDSNVSYGTDGLIVRITDVSEGIYNAAEIGKSTAALRMKVTFEYSCFLFYEKNKIPSRKILYINDR